MLITFLVVMSSIRLECPNSWFLRNFYLRHKNGSNLVIFGPIHLISFAYEHWQQGSKRSFYEHHYTWFILEQLLSRSVRIILLSVISKNEKFDKSIVWWFQSNRRSSKVISVLIWIYIFRPKWQSPRIIRTIIRFHIFKFLCLVSLYILKVGALLMREYPIN